MNPITRFHGNESGATAVVFAISIFLLLGATALTVDAGNLWTTRRSLVTDTDAAALAGAATMDASSKSECLLGTSYAAAQARSEELLSQNGDATLNDFDVIPGHGCEWGMVRIDAEDDVEFAFAHVSGSIVSNSGVFSSSTAAFGPTLSVDRLRPFGICSKDEHFMEWELADGDPTNSAYATLKGSDPFLHPSTNLNGEAYTGNRFVIHRIRFGAEALQPCDSTDDKSAGNWGWLDYDGGGPESVPDDDCAGAGGGGAKDLGCRIDHGYPGSVSLAPAGDPTAYDCDQTETGNEGCPSQPGAVHSAADDLDKLICPRDKAHDSVACVEKQFLILVYDEVLGNARNAAYKPYAFLGVVLRDYDSNALTGQPQQDDSFDLEFINLQRSGAIGPVAGSPTTVTGVALCGGNYGAEIDLGGICKTSE